MEKVCGIYKIENLVNGKMYIGKTKRGFSKRFKEHKWDLRGNRHGNPHFQNAWNKYREECFSFDIILICDEDDLEKMEEEQFDLWWPTGRLYNIVSKSQKVNGRTVGVDCYDLKGNFVRSFDSVNEASEFYNISNTHLSTVIGDGGQTAANFYWVYSGEKLKVKETKKRVGQSLSVCCYDMDTGNLVNTFNSTVEAGSFYGIHYTTIYAVCEGRNISTGGYCWAYEGEDVVIRASKWKVAKAVSCFDDDGMCIKKFDSIRDAAMFFNGDASAICCVCGGKNRKAYGYFWAYDGEKPIIRDKKSDPKIRPVLCFSKEGGRFIDEFCSAEEAGRELGISTKHISCVCQGKRKSSYGYVFEYA